MNVIEICFFHHRSVSEKDDNQRKIYQPRIRATLSARKLEKEIRGFSWPIGGVEFKSCWLLNEMERKMNRDPSTFSSPEFRSWSARWPKDNRDRGWFDPPLDRHSDPSFVSHAELTRVAELIRIMDASHRSWPFVKIVKYGFFFPQIIQFILTFHRSARNRSIQRYFFFFFLVSNEQNFNRFQPKTTIKQDWLILPQVSSKRWEDESFFLKGEGHVRYDSIGHEILTKLSMCLPRFENSPSLSITDISSIIEKLARV